MTVTQTATHTTEAATTPTGAQGVRITCPCAVCGGKAAIVRQAYADEHQLTAQTKQAATHVHNMVLMAQGPLRNAPQVKANGPWPA